MGRPKEWVSRLKRNFPELSRPVRTRRNMVQRKKGNESTQGVNESTQPDFSKGKKEINVNWVYKMKLNPKGEVTQHKAILVAKRFLQKKGIIFNEVFALVATIETTSLVVGLANMNNLHMYHMDVKCAFLNGPLD